MSDGDLDTSTTVMVAPLSLDHASLLPLYFLKVQREPGSPFDLFKVLATKVVKLVLILEMIENVISFDDVFEAIVSLVVVEFFYVDLPISFDVLSRFVSYSNGVPTFSSMNINSF